jgi:hypothetical protein
MTLPNFVGIGAPRAGTTWLNTLLCSHPDVYTPPHRDEINFFDQYYDRGLGWYEAFFPTPEEAKRYRAIGEITPQYLEHADCPARIRKTLPEGKLLVMLRHPVTRAYSQYGFFVQRRNFRGSFEEFLADRPRSLERGFFSRYLKRYLQYYQRQEILALVFEEAVSDVNETKRRLAGFLNVDSDRFPASAGAGKVNSSSVPRFQTLYGCVARTGRLLRKWRLEPVVDCVMRSRLPNWLAKGKSLPPLDNDVKERVSRQYQQEFEELEQCLDIDLSCWRTVSRRA